MSSIPVPASMGSAKVDTYQRTDIGGTDTVDMQVVVPGNPFSPTSGSLSATGSVSAANLNDACSALVVLQGTFSATIIFEGTVDGNNWFPVQAARADANSSVTTAGLALVFTAQTLAHKVDLNGVISFRVRVTAYTSGAVGVVIAPSPHSMQPTPYTTLPSVIGVNASTSTTGQSIYKIISAASNNAANIKTSAGKVYGWFLTNEAASKRYVKLYNKNAAPTVGTDVPVLTLSLLPGQTVTFSDDIGRTFSAGIGIAITANQADTDNTSVTAGDVVGGVFWV